MTNAGIYRELRGAIICAALLGMAGCAGLANANKRSPGTVTGGQFKPGVAPEANYGPDPKLTCPTGGVNGALTDLLKREDLKGKKLTPDGRLCALADTLLGWNLPNNEVPPEIVRAFLSQYFGLTATLQPGSFLITDEELQDAKPLDIASSLVSPLTGFAENAKAPIYGVISERISGANSAKSGGAGALPGTYRVRLVMFDDQVQLDTPLPRSLPSGGTANVTGHVEGSYKNIKVQTVDSSGKLTTTPAAGNTFNVPIACGDRPGKLLLQITGESDSGDVRLANLPVVCAGELPATVAMPGASTGPIDPAAAEKKLADTLNGDRTGANLKALNVSGPLSDIARALAEKQAAGKAVSGSDLTSMMKEKEIQAPNILENAARAFSVDEAYAKLSDSPSDRANEMSPDVTDLGIGVAKGGDLGGKPTIIVTVLYIKTLPPADPVAAKTKLYDAIAKKRAEAKADEVAKDDTLDSVAQKYADAAAANSGQVPKDKETEIMAPLYKNAMVVNQMGGWVPDEAGVLEQANSGTPLAKGKLVGVGVASGKSVQYGKNSLYIVIMVGTRHEAPKPAKKKKR
jgi:uncharacterized protein YkwD